MHEVTLSNGFYLGKYEVTQAQYEAVMTGNSDGSIATSQFYNWNERNDIQVFLTRLNAEYPCRVGVCIAHRSPVGVIIRTTKYSWGDSITMTPTTIGMVIGIRS